MSITYSLSKNNLTNGANYYRAVIQSMATANLDQVVDRMIAHGCAVSRTDALAVIHHYFAAVESYLLEGYRVSTPWVNHGLSIRGNFDGKTDSYDPGRHSIEAVTTTGARLRRAIRERAQAQKELAGRIQPELLEYTDWSSGQHDSTLTPGGLGQLIGKGLKFDPGQPGHGLFFIAVADGRAAPATVVSHNTDGQLTFLVPAGLAAGDYTVEVRSTMGQGPLRTGSLEAILTVS
ncbi:MAG: DNA-binding domain-containing protein [Chloroflexota bacterium]